MISEARATEKDDQSARQPVSGLCSFVRLTECGITATESMAGVLDDLYFDGEAWVVRFVVVKLRDEMGGRCVLMPPSAIERRDWESRLLVVSLTLAQLLGRGSNDGFVPSMSNKNYPYLVNQIQALANDRRHYVDEALVRFMRSFSYHIRRYSRSIL